MGIGIVIIVTFAVIVYFVYESIVFNKIMKESQNKIMGMLTKVYDVAELFIIGVFTSVWNWGSDDDDTDIK